MLRAALTPTRESSTTQSTAVVCGSDAACTHSFAASPHYCSYVHAPELRATLRPATSPDEQLVISFLGASVIWWHLQEQELAAVERSSAADGGPSSPYLFEAATQRLDRCIALAQTMQEASSLVMRYIIIPAPRIHVGFHIQGELNIIPLARNLAAVITRLQMWHSSRASEALPEIRNRIQEYGTIAEENLYVLKRLIATLQDHSMPGVALDTLLTEELVSWSRLTMKRHHPQVLTNPDTTTPGVFVAAHQLFEIMFPVTISALEAAIGCLTAGPGQVMAAVPLVTQAADTIRLWQRMIHAPQTMSAADYIDEVRGQIEGGSGAESHQFRLFEVLAGLRNARYRRTLTRMQLLTPPLEALWEQPSLNDAILRVLAQRGVLSPDAPLKTQAAQIATILRPTGTVHPHADLAALCQAALSLDEQLWLWRCHHMAMVDAMIGSKPSIGIGSKQNQQRLTHGRLPRLINVLPSSGRRFAHWAVWWRHPIGGMPYLRQTTHYHLFPLISQALAHVQEHWQEAANAPLER